MRDVAWNGSRFVVVYESVFTPGSSGPFMSEVYGLAVSPGGTTEPKFLIAQAARSDVLPAASRGPDQELGVSYNLLTASICCTDPPLPPYTGADRVFLRTAS